MKVCIIISLAILSVWNVMGQDLEIPNFSVHLTDDSYYLGKLIDQTDHGVSLEIVTGDTIFFSNTIIFRQYDLTKVRMLEDRKFHYQSGMFYGFQAGIGISDSPSSMLKAQIGTRALPQLAVGTGVIANRYEGFSFDNPIFLAPGAFLRYYVNNGHNRIYGFSFAGWGLPVNSEFVEYDSGFFHQSGVGVVIANGKKFKFTIELGQQSQKYRSREVNFFDPFLMDSTFIERDGWLHHVFISVGMEFN